nr:hypothetical protein Hi04_10k_c5380_00022 [uncultured bacterium]
MRVDVTFVRVQTGAAADAPTLADLTDVELESIQRLGMPADRDRRATAYSAARRTLARMLGMHPRRVPLMSTASGQPIVDRSRVGVSWSHSGCWVALAIAPEGAVGVDIERRPATLPMRALRVLDLASIEEFVAREAAGKATGQGLGERWPAGIVIRSLPAPEGYVAAVAASGPTVSVHCGSVDNVRTWSHHARTISGSHIAAVNVWAYPEGISWGGSRLWLSRR